MQYFHSISPMTVKLGYMVTSDRISDVSAFCEKNLNYKVARGCPVSNMTLLTQYMGETSAFGKNPTIFRIVSIYHKSVMHVIIDSMS